MSRVTQELTHGTSGDRNSSSIESLLLVVLLLVCAYVLAVQIILALLYTTLYF